MKNAAGAVCGWMMAIAASAALAGPSEDLDALFEDYWAYELREDPLKATGAGVNTYNDKMPAVAPEDHARRRVERSAFLTRLDGIDVSAVDREDALSADLLRFILKHDIALAAYDPWRNPILADGGFHSDIGYAVGATPFRDVADYEAYIGRLSAVPDYIDQNVANMRKGLADGFTQPQQIIDLILPSFEAQVTEAPEDHPLYAPFQRMADAVPEKRQKTLTREAAAVLRDAVVPAYSRALAFMKEEYAPGAVDKVGASNLPDGEAYYEALVRYYTTLDDATADDIHQLGLKEVARIRKEMDAVIKETGFEGTFPEFLDFLRTDPQFYAKSSRELLMEAAFISKDIDGRLPAFFGKLPRQPYSVEPVPAAIARNYTTGRYVSAPPGGNRGGQYWVNTYALNKRPLYQLTALSLHEAVPGHHFQIALSYEIEDAPDFRRQFYPHAYGEGWGLYAEKLGVEMGVYKTPYEHFGRLSYEMWRACRLVIDTGLHSKGWTRKQAMDYLASNTALSLHNVQTEVDRYISWPGQALAYKMGELTIWELRAKAARELGDDFDIRTFHDAVLTGGGLPLELLRKRIDAYIGETEKNAR
ncbi:MAG: DUF885 domain-containing protein [Pseudomonadota bacterium]